jgi:hypothetical protein
MSPDVGRVGVRHRGTPDFFALFSGKITPLPTVT